MRTILPIPVEYAGTCYVAAEYRLPSAGALADTRKLAEQGSQFGAFHVLLQGVVNAFEDDAGGFLEDRGQVRAACKYLPQRSAEVVVMKSLAGLSEDDGIEGFYKCPRCAQELICERSVDIDGEVLVDNRDSLGGLEIATCENGAVETIELREPVIIKARSSQGEEAEDEILSLSIHAPTMADCMAAERKTPGTDKIRRQLAIYVEATESVNGEPVDERWKNAVGKPVYERLSGPDVIRFGHAMERYGLQTGVLKTCGRCGKEWEEDVDLSSFFGSALRVV